MGLDHQNSIILNAQKQNERTKNLKYTYDYKGHKVPNVQSIEAKKKANILIPGSDKKIGKYSFNQASAKDVKSSNLQKTMAMREYRQTIDEGMKILQSA
jgi:hypothetical protein